MTDSTVTYDDDDTLEALLGPDVVERLGRAALKVTLTVRGDGGERDPRAALAAVVEELRHLSDSRVTQNRMVALGRVSAGLVHEVRNVITGIFGFAQVAQAKHEPQRVAEFLALIERESQRCLDLLSRYLDFARAAKRAPAPVDLAEVVAGATKLVGHQLSLNHVRLVVEADPATPRIAGHPALLTQVLVNLTLNAMQAMTDGGTVWVRARRDGDGAALLQVADDGPGISPAIRARLGQPFVTTKPPGLGSGLGLWVSRDIVAEHHGTFTVESEEGKGATFTLRFPPLEAGEGGR